MTFEWPSSFTTLYTIKTDKMCAELLFLSRKPIASTWNQKRTDEV